jgi:hypothetical protein
MASSDPKPTSGQPEGSVRRWLSRTRFPCISHTKLPGSPRRRCSNAGSIADPTRAGSAWAITWPLPSTSASCTLASAANSPNCSLQYSGL